MAHSQGHVRSTRGGVAPWAAFVLGMVVVLAAAAAFLFTTGRIMGPLQAVNVGVHRPSLPDMKMPAAPPMPRG